ncbi:uncharacterized protein LOC119110824, partial [Pollicipes pollicipes]|uniref:uncharacterized protein LOC119110824 n=1 Tax=Pollicipes pollicipes TaxID=41117 RepID=UPI001884A500
MVSHDKKLYNNLLQMAMLASLLRFQPDMYGLQDQPVDGDLILGQSWAHTSARTVHAQLEHFASHKNIDNVIERYQEELFEELNALGRYNRIYASDIQAYQVLDGEATPAGDGPTSPEPAPANATEPPHTTLDLDLDLDGDREQVVPPEPGRPARPDLAPLDLDLGHGLERADFDVWEMMDADLAEAGLANEPLVAAAAADEELVTAAGDDAVDELLASVGRMDESPVTAPGDGPLDEPLVWAGSMEEPLVTTWPANEWAGASRPADELLASSGPADELLASTGAADELVASAGLVDELLASTGAADELMISAGAEDEPFGSSGPSADWLSVAGPSRSSFSTDVSDDFIQLDADMSDEDAEAIEVLLKQDIDLGLTRCDLDPARSPSGRPHDG